MASIVHGQSSWNLAGKFESLSDFASAIRLRRPWIRRIPAHSAGIPLLSHLSGKFRVPKRVIYFFG
jgi:hypothetical protein